MPPQFDVSKLLRDVFDPQPGERGLVLVDVPAGRISDSPDWQERRCMAADWQAALADLGLEIPSVTSYAATGSGNADLPVAAELEGAEVSLPQQIANANLVIAMTEFSATAPLSRFVKENSDLRVASMPGVLRRMEQTALSADYAEVARKVAVLQELAERAHFATLRFATGHQIRFDLRFRHAYADDGQCRSDSPFPLINLPSGEAFIVPYEGEQDGEPSQTAGQIPVQVGDAQVVYVVEGNRIIDVQGGPAAGERRAWFEADPARANIAELGLGCNDAAVVLGNVLEDEKAGIHWAYGRSEHLGGVVGPDAFRKPENVVHMDIVYAPGCPIETDSLTLQFSDGSEQDILEKNRWTVFD